MAAATLLCLTSPLTLVIGPVDLSLLDGSRKIVEITPKEDDVQLMHMETNLFVESWCCSPSGVV